VHANKQTLETFYSAFARLDPQTMGECYAPGAVFEDEVFSLRGQRSVAGMWRMLCEATRAKGADVWKLQYRDLHADAGTGQAHWDAHYRFSATGRIVDNSIDAAFGFDPQGRIERHRDSFDFWRWSRQALGAPGLLLGWTPLLRNKVRAQAGASLDKFMAKETR
jgi:hypothetical protein